MNKRKEKPNWLYAKWFRWENKESLLYIILPGIFLFEKIIGWVDTQRALMGVRKTKYAYGIEDMDIILIPLISFAIWGMVFFSFHLLGVF